MTPTYSPTAGSKTDQALVYVEKHAPAGGERWLTAPEIAAGTGIASNTIGGVLRTPETHGLVIRRKDSQLGTVYQAAPSDDVVLCPIQITLPAAHAGRPETTAAPSVFAMAARLATDAIA